MKPSTAITLASAALLIAGCTTLQSEIRAQVKTEISQEDAKRNILRDGRYDLIKGASGRSCAQTCAAEPNAISCRQALEDDDCVVRAEQAKLQLE